MNTLEKKMESYGVSIYEWETRTNELRPLETIINAHRDSLNDLNITFANDQNGIEHTRYFLYNAFTLHIEDADLFVRKLNLRSGDTLFPSITFVNASIDLSSSGEFLFLSKGKIINRRDAFFKHVTNHLDFYKNEYPEWHMKRIFDQKTADTELLKILLPQKRRLMEKFNNRFNLEELFTVIASEFKQTLAEMHGAPVQK